MTEKTVSKHLAALERYFAASNPVLQKISKIFHELDQLEYELGLLDMEDTTARKSSWWPTVGLIGGFSSAKTEFVNRYFQTNLHASNHKFTVYQYSPQQNSATLPGSALDADHRLPFYQISQKIERIEKGEGSKINAYLELKTVNSEKLKGKLFITTPVLNGNQNSPVTSALVQQVLNMSDLTLVFADFFDAPRELTQATIDEIVAQQDSNKFIYVIDHSEISLNTNKTNEIIASWQRKLAALGIHTGQFIVLSDLANGSTQNAYTEIEQRLVNIENDRTYRVLNTLERNIQSIGETYFPEVEKQLVIWKERINMSTLIIVGFLISLLLFAEITMGLAQLLFDPIIGPIFIVVSVILLIPIHLTIAKVHAKLIINQLNERQKKLAIPENLSGLFEKSLTFWRIVLPIDEPVGKNKKTQSRIAALVEKTKDMVQELNDQFSHYHQDDF